MHPNLSFEQAPPISVPFRFFLTAPLFGVLAGLLLVWLGEDALASRWTPGALALTHLLTTGFMLQAMCGALLQFVPVICGGNVWRPRLVAGLLHPTSAIAALMLAGGFALQSPLLMLPAVLLFAVGLGVFLCAAGIALWRTPALGPAIRLVRFALFGLALTLLLGFLLAAILGGHGNWVAGWSMLGIVDAHVAWGLGGWALLLVIGVSSQVVPMFQMTPQYPAVLLRWLPLAMLLPLGLLLLQPLPGELLPAFLFDAAAPCAVLLAALYAAVTLRLQARRRRRMTDANFLFWRGAMLSLLGFAASWLAMLALPDLGAQLRFPVWLGVLALDGVFVGLISGMLCKIVPFLNWLHLQQLAGLKTLPPNIKQMIPEGALRGQLISHFIAFGLLLAAVIWPSLARLAGLAFAVSCLWLEWNLVGAVRLYVDFKDRTRADDRHRES
jgi:hypothetical protein